MNLLPELDFFDRLKIQLEKTLKSDIKRVNKELKKIKRAKLKKLKSQEKQTIDINK